MFRLSLMVGGNLWSYALVRTITTHGDIALIAHGLGILDLDLVPVVVMPTSSPAWSGCW